MSDLPVLYHDNHLLGVEKVAGMPSVPDESGDASLLDVARAWVEREREKPGRAFLGVVHRLDRPVSGVVLFARTSKAADRLTACFRDGRAIKTYLAVTRGVPGHPVGVLEQWLVKDRQRNRVCPSTPDDERGKRAVTRWRVLAEVTWRGAPSAVVELCPETGRSHQLRVACASLGTPILGDLRYGAREPLVDRSVALHALSLRIPHPTREEEVRLAAPLPAGPWWDAARGAARAEGSRGPAAES